MIVIISGSPAQDIREGNDINLQKPTSEINKNRLKWSIAIGGLTYAGASAFLYQSWYQEYPQSNFHFFNDLPEWRGIDKLGHSFSGYFQSQWAYKGWRWVGLDQKGALWAGGATSFLAQSTIEVFDGFSTQWGFSAGDFMANLVGIGGFTVQQALWGQQKILLKVSSSPVDYDQRYGSTVISARAEQLYGSGGLTAENLFGGFANQFDVAIEDAPQRYSQFYISLDADLARIKTSSPFVRTMLDILNVLKVPFSAIEINTRGEVRFHLVSF